MSVRPWRDIARRQSRQIMVGNVPVGGDAPITVQTMTNTPTRRRQGDDRPDPPLRGSRRRHRPRLLPRRRIDRGLEADRPRRATCRSSPTSISTTSARSRRPTRARRACASIPAISARRSGCARWSHAAKANGCAMRIGVNAGSLEKDLLEKYGEPCPEALVESALDHIRILEDHDFREYQGRGEGVRRVPRGRRLSAARRSGRLPAASRHHRGRRRWSAARSRARSASASCCGPGSATRSASRFRPSPRRKSASASRS